MRSRSVPSSLGRALTVGILMVSCAALVAVATLASADGTPRRLYRPTHVGVAPSDLVMLSSTGNKENLKFVQVKPDGTIDTAEYAVPSGFRLVVTDVDWGGQAPFQPQTLLRVFIENKASPTTRNVVYMSNSIIKTDSTFGSYAPVGGSSGTLTGFSVSSGGRLTADATLPSTATAAYPSTFNNFYFQGLVVLRGYLVPDA